MNDIRVVKMIAQPAAQIPVVSPFGLLAGAFNERILRRMQLKNGLYQLYSLQFLEENEGERRYAPAPSYKLNFQIKLEDKSQVAQSETVLRERIYRMIERMGANGLVQSQERLQRVSSPCNAKTETPPTKDRQTTQAAERTSASKKGAADAKERVTVRAGTNERHERLHEQRREVLRRERWEKLRRELRESGKKMPQAANNQVPIRRQFFLLPHMEEGSPRREMAALMPPLSPLSSVESRNRTVMITEAKMNFLNSRADAVIQTEPLRMLGEETTSSNMATIQMPLHSQGLLAVAPDGRRTGSVPSLPSSGQGIENEMLRFTGQMRARPDAIRGNADMNAMAFKVIERVLGQLKADGKTPDRAQHTAPHNLEVILHEDAPEPFSKMRKGRQSNQFRKTVHMLEEVLQRRVGPKILQALQGEGLTQPPGERQPLHKPPILRYFEYDNQFFPTGSIDHSGKEDKKIQPAVQALQWYQLFSAPAWQITRTKSERGPAKELLQVNQELQRVKAQGKQQGPRPVHNAPNVLRTGLFPLIYERDKNPALTQTVTQRQDQMKLPLQHHQLLTQNLTLNVERNSAPNGEAKPALRQGSTPMGLRAITALVGHAPAPRQIPAIPERGARMQISSLLQGRAAMRQQAAHQSQNDHGTQRGDMQATQQNAEIKGANPATLPHLSFGELTYTQAVTAVPPPAMENPTQQKADRRQDSDYIKSLPQWARSFLEESDRPGGQRTSELQKVKSDMRTARPLGIAQKKGEESVWMAPSYTSTAVPPNTIVHKIKQPNQALPTKLSSAEMNKMANKVYDLVMERVSRERRRMGF